MVRALFLAGHTSVVVDATNTTRKRRDRWQSDEWVTRFAVFDTRKNVCLHRAGNDEVIKPVIERMHRQWEPLGEGEVATDYQPLGE